MFDNLILLAEGHMVYNGPTKDVVAYFSDLGYPCPKYTNPAEFVSMFSSSTSNTCLWFLEICNHDNNTPL